MSGRNGGQFSNFVLKNLGQRLRTLLFLLMAASTVQAETYPLLYEEFLNQTEVSPKASEVLESYRTNGCEQNQGVRGYRPNIDYEPVFMVAEDTYRRVELTKDGVVAELIQTKGMQCGHLYLDTCGSSGCWSEIVFNGLVYPIKGKPFLLMPEPIYENRSERSIPPLIAWWGYGGACHTQEDEETDPIHTNSPTNCLLTAHYDSKLQRLVFQHDYSLWPEPLRQE